MLSVDQQARTRKLVCPVSHQELTVVGASLVTADGSRRYAIVDGVPILLADEVSRDGYLGERGGAMLAEYSSGRRASRVRRRFDAWINQRKLWPARVERALGRVLFDQPGDALVLSVGGGPDRWSSNAVNINIERFDNVDVVADAYALPYADETVDAVFCWAVLEHLEFPDRAMQEIFRVLRPGGLLLAGTPFLQAFHAYPNHFQNYTRVGHERLVERAGLVVEDSGGLGATFALVDLVSVYLRTYVPGRVLGGIISRLVRLVVVVTARLDRRLAERADGDIVASNTFVLAAKPAC